MSPLGLKGPCSQNAPAPIDEQPGPSKFIQGFQILFSYEFIQVSKDLKLSLTNRLM